MTTAFALTGKIFASALLLGTCTMAPCQEADADGPPPGWVGPPPGWSGGALGGLYWVPDFEGSRTSNLQPVPGFEMTYRSEHLGSVEMGSRGVAWTIVRSDWYSAGVGQSTDTGRIDTRTRSLSINGFRTGSARLKGMGAIDSTPLVSAFASVSLLGIPFSATVRRATKSYRGAQLDLGFGIPWKIGKHFDVTLSPGVTLADKHYMQAYFGVTALQAGRTGRQAFDASAGLKSAQLSLDLDMAFSRHWHAIADLQAKRLLRDAAHSPITEKSTQSSALLGALYEFQL